MACYWDSTVVHHGGGLHQCRYPGARHDERNRLHSSCVRYFRDYISSSTSLEDEVTRLANDVGHGQYATF